MTGHIPGHDLHHSVLGESSSFDSPNPKIGISGTPSNPTLKETCKSSSHGVGSRVSASSSVSVPLGGSSFSCWRGNPSSASLICRWREIGNRGSIRGKWRQEQNCLGVPHTSEIDTEKDRQIRVELQQILAARFKLYNMLSSIILIE